MGALQDKARKARNLAKESFGGVSYSATKKIATNNAKAAGKKITSAEETRAAKIMQTRRQNDRDRTMARGEFIAGPKSPRAKRETKANISAAVSGGAAKKTTSKPKAKMNPSEKEFIKGQKVKAKIMKKTGKYPNTAN